MGSNFIFLLAMLAIMYFMLIKPQKTQMENRNQMMNSLAEDDLIATIGGIKGKIIKVMEDSIILEIAENVQIELDKSGVAHVITEDEDEYEDYDEYEEEIEENEEESL